MMPRLPHNKGRAPARARDRAPWRVPGAGLLLLCALLPTLAAGADVRAFFDRPRVYEGDTVTLTIEVAGAGNRLAPDLAPLNQDFEVGGTQFGTEISIINGRRTDRTTYNVALLPRRTGTLTVPALRVGTAVTEPLTLTVEPVPAGGIGTPGDRLFLEVSVEGDPDALIVNQQVPVVVRAYSAATLYDYSLRLPDIEGAVLTQLGRETARMTQRNGTPYRVVEWRFSLSPERSGELRIGPLVFDARVEDPNAVGAADPFGRAFRDPMFDRMFGGGLPGRLGLDRGQTARAQSAPLTLRVAAAPTDFDGAWLPATAVRLTDDWTGAPPRLAVGEPATRTLTIRADGLTGNQIPEFEIPLPTGARGYLGRTEATTESDGAGVYGISRQQLTIIPQQGGTLVLPEVRIPWWDTTAKVRREAILPALRLEVAGPVGAPAPVPAPALTTPKPAAGGGPVAPPAGATRTWGWWPWAVALLGVLGVALGWGWRQRRVPAPQAPRPPVAPPSPMASPGPRAEAARERLREACAGSDPNAAAKALLALAAVSLPESPPVNLSALAARVDQGADAIRALERVLYAPDAGPWDGAALWAAVQRGLCSPTRAGADDDDPLPPLYPSRS